MRVFYAARATQGRDVCPVRAAERKGTRYGATAFGTAVTRDAAHRPNCVLQPRLRRRDIPWHVSSQTCSPLPLPWVVYGRLRHMPAQLLYRQKLLYPDGAIREMVLWQLPRPTKDRPHGLKYRLYYG